MNQDIPTREVIVAAPGDASTLVEHPSHIGAIGPDDVILRQDAIGVNFHDIYVRSGAARTMPYPGTPGIEAAGVIMRTGSTVKDFRPGQRVAYVSGAYGAYADIRRIGASHLVPLPDGIAAQTAAATLLKGITAHMLLTRLVALRRGDCVLVHAAAGGTGQLLVQMACARGLRVLGIAGNREKANRAMALGCEAVAIRGHDDVIAMVRASTGGAGVRAVFDGIGAATVQMSLEALAPFGHLCILGQVSGQIGSIQVADLAPKSLSCSRPIVFHHVAQREAYRQSAQAVFDGLLDGSIRIEPPVRYALSDIASAHRALESGTTQGSMIVTPDPA